MIDLLKKTIFTGIGFAASSREKLEEWAKSLAEESKLAEAEGKKFVEDILEKSDEAKKGMEKQVKEWVDTALNTMNLHTESEVGELKKRIDDLEEKLKTKE